MVLRRDVAPTLDGGPWFDDRVLLDREVEATPRIPDLGRPQAAEGGTSRTTSPCCFPNSFRSGLLAWLGGARRRVGYAQGRSEKPGSSPTGSSRLGRSSCGNFAPVPIAGLLLPEARPQPSIARSIPRCGPGTLSSPRPRTIARGRCWRLSRLGLGLGRERPVVCLNNGRGLRSREKLAGRPRSPALARAAGRRAARLGRARALRPGRSATRPASDRRRWRIIPESSSLADQAMSLGLTRRRAWSARPCS